MTIKQRSTLAQVFAVLICVFALIAGKYLGAPASALMLGIIGTYLYGGRRPAQTAVLLSSVLFICFVVPSFRHLLHPRGGLLRVALFCTVTAATLGVMEARERTERKRLQTLLDLQSVVETSPDCIAFLDKDRVIQFANPVLQTLFNFSSQQLIGRPLSLLLPQLSLETELKGEFLAKRNDGVCLFVEITCGRFGETTTVFLRDITDRKRQESERGSVEASLRQTQATLAHANQIAIASGLATSIVHEISQPLSAMLANGQASLRWLQNQPPNLANVCIALERLVRDGKEAMAIARGLRAIFGHTSPDKAVVDLCQICQEIVPLLRAKSERAGIAIQMEMAQHLPPVAADAVSLQQVLINLVTNGMESMQTITASAKTIVLSATPQESSVLVTVADQGTGVTDYESLFAPFFTTKPKGMGMGLVISRSIIEAHGGALWGVPQATGGSLFCFTIPTASGGSNARSGNDGVPH